MKLYKGKGGVHYELLISGKVRKYKDGAYIETLNGVHSEAQFRRLGYILVGNNFRLK